MVPGECAPGPLPTAPHPTPLGTHYPIVSAGSPLNPYFLPPYFLPKGLLLSYSLPGSHSPGISIPRTSRDFHLSP